LIVVAARQMYTLIWANVPPGAHVPQVGNPCFTAYNSSQLLTTFTKYFRLITDAHPYNTRQTLIRQFALPKHLPTQVRKR